MEIGGARERFVYNAAAEKQKNRGCMRHVTDSIRKRMREA
jgi:hypothetical protein